MSLRYLLDSSIAIDLLRRPNRALYDRLQQHTGALATSTVVVTELRFGAEASMTIGENHHKVDALLQLISVLDFDAAAAEHAGEIRARLKTAGTPIGPYDAMIAGHARSRGLVVVTGNVREFERVDGLRVEQWG